MAEPGAGTAPTPTPAFEALQRRFIAGLGARWQAIVQARDATQQHAALHRLAGAAGSYGLVAIGAAARQAEAALVQADAAGLRLALDHLARELAAAGVTVL